MTFALKGGYVVSKMLTYVYIGSVGPFENVYISKKNCEYLDLIECRR